mmetsp:Transcript_36021/g.57675  ORF Transcript_36021/g.57675 Transcript_36021/m.57675 type:complete len:310 (+) Transcript_36021:2790-3719(+)
MFKRNPQFPSKGVYGREGPTCQYDGSTTFRQRSERNGRVQAPNAKLNIFLFGLSDNNTKISRKTLPISHHKLNGHKERIYKLTDTGWERKFLVLFIKLRGLSELCTHLTNCLLSEPEMGLKNNKRLCPCVNTFFAQSKTILLYNNPVIQFLNDACQEFICKSFFVRTIRSQFVQICSHFRNNTELSLEGRSITTHTLHIVSLVDYNYRPIKYCINSHRLTNQRIEQIVVRTKYQICMLFGYLLGSKIRARTRRLPHRDKVLYIPNFAATITYHFGVGTLLDKVFATDPSWSNTFSTCLILCRSRSKLFL